MFKLEDYVTNLKRTPKLVLGSFPSIVNFDYSLKDAFLDPNKMADLAVNFDQQFNLDFIRTITDLTFEAQILGAEVSFPKMAPPKILSTPFDSVEQLINGKYSLLESRFEVYTSAYKVVMESTDTPLIVSLTGPFTLLSSILDYQYIQKLLREGNYPVLAQGLNYVANLTLELVDRLNTLKPPLLMVSDPVASLLKPEPFKELLLNQYKKIFNNFQGDTILHICGDITEVVESLQALPHKCLSVDEKVNLEVVLRHCDKDKYILGNISPIDVMVKGDTKTVTAETTKLINLAQKYTNLIPATGCTLPFNTPHRNIETFLRT